MTGKPSPVESAKEPGRTTPGLRRLGTFVSGASLTRSVIPVVGAVTVAVQSISFEDFGRAGRRVVPSISDSLAMVSRFRIGPTISNHTPAKFEPARPL